MGSFQFSTASASRKIQPSEVQALFTSFTLRYWKHGNWDGASSWTGDNMSRLMIHYLNFWDFHNGSDEADSIFTKLASRSLNKWTLVQYLTQGYDDFGWTVFSLLELRQYSYQHAEKYPTSPTVVWLPLLRDRLAFRLGFLQDVIEDSWTDSPCGGGAEWKVRLHGTPLWPSWEYAAIYKNTITNHLYNGNNAQMYNISCHAIYPVEITEITVHYLRAFWKLVRPLFGWPRTGIRYRHFQNPSFLERALRGIEWMYTARFLNDETLYMDGIRPRAFQRAPDEPATIVCNHTTKALFTYNQVAGIRAFRSLFQATCKVELLERGHDVIARLVEATYSGHLGWNGILEDVCDRFANCTQDMQMFKGSTLLDILDYCKPVTPGVYSSLPAWHKGQCQTYRGWIEGNAEAAYATRDSSGRFSGHWGLNKTQVTGKSTIETQASGLAVLLTAVWFNREFMSIE